MKTSDPRIGRVYADWMMDQDVSKAHAADTLFRFSSAMDCARHLGYYAAGYEATDPMDGPSRAVTEMGSLLHEDIQTAVALRWPSCRFEIDGILGDLTSGHVDIDDPDADESIEIKTVGGYKWQLAVGYMSPKGQPAFIKAAGGKGPSKAHICQAGMNAQAAGRTTVRIIYLSREAVSVKKARQAGLDSIGRFWAEWTFPPEVWKPLVAAEVNRLAKIRDIVAAGELPGRQDFEDSGKMFEPNPDYHWRCDGYCSMAQQCAKDGPGRIKIRPALKLVAS